MHRTLMRVLPFAALLEALLTVRNLLTLQPPARVIIPVFQILFIGFIAVVWFWLRGRPTGERLNDALLTGFMAGIGWLILLELALTGNGMLSANLALMVVVGGALIRPAGHFAAFCAVLVLTWVAIVAGNSTWAMPVIDQATYLFIGVAIASFVFVLRHADRRVLEQTRDEAMRSAMQDQLTGLWNRRGLQEIMPSMAAGAQETQTRVWCVFIDVRGLKAVNDTYGHEAGDVLLSAVGAALRGSSRVHGVAARWGGDEFCLLGVGPRPSLDEAYDDLMAHMSHLSIPKGVWDLSLGVADTAAGASDVLLSLVAEADADMYRRRGTDGRRTNASS